RRAIVLAEAQDDAELLGQHPVDPGRQPEQDQRGDDQRDALAGAEPARHQAAELFLAASQQLLDVGRLRAAAARTLPVIAAAAAPRSATPGSPAPGAAAALLMHTHEAEIPLRRCLPRRLCNRCRTLLYDSGPMRQMKGAPGDGCR